MMNRPSNAPVSAHFDGLCEPERHGGPRNPGGLACGGWFIEAHPDVPGLEQPVSDGAFYLRGQGATCNVAEYMAALDCLRAIYRTGYRGPVALMGDSQLVVKQFTGEYMCRSPHLEPLLAKLHIAARQFDPLWLRWVPREQNERADAESRRAYQAALKLSLLGARE